MQDFQIKIIDSVDAADFMELYRDAGWWDESCTPDFIPELVSNSVVFAGAFIGDKMVGMGRAIGDGCSDVYIQDVIVLTRCRGRGIGSRMIYAIIRELRKRNIDWIGLIGEPGTKPFYEKLGFAEMEKHIPMKLQ